MGHGWLASRVPKEGIYNKSIRQLPTKSDQWLRRQKKRRMTAEKNVNRIRGIQNRLQRKNEKKGGIKKHEEEFENENKEEVRWIVTK